MSKNCFLVLSDIPTGKNAGNVRWKIEQCACGAGMKAFFDFSYSDPVLCQYAANAVVCSIADNPRWDNCEMLFLPDNCAYNGRKNEDSFYDRMQRMADFLAALPFCSAALFIGDSGTLVDEYETVETTVARFADSVSDKLTEYELPPLHVILGDPCRTDG